MMETKNQAIWSEIGSLSWKTDLTVISINYKTLKYSR